MTNQHTIFAVISNKNRTTITTKKKNKEPPPYKQGLIKALTIKSLL